jgi:hypothetical protein
MTKLWDQLKKDIREISLISTWTDQDWKCTKTNSTTLYSPSLRENSTYNSKFRSTPQVSLQPIGPPPPADFVKINFDGPSKGNTWLAVLGGDFRNNKGSIIRFYAENMGTYTNNAT